MTTTPTARGYLATQLGTALVALRAKAGRSQRAQARELGIAGNTLREVELGLANPTLARVEELADQYGVTVELRVKRRRR